MTVTGDTVDEPDETVVHRTVQPEPRDVLGTATGTGTITDDDATPTVTLVLSPGSISENGGVSTVTATLDRASSEATTVTVSAAAVAPAVSGDFTLSANKVLTIAAGATGEHRDGDHHRGGQHPGCAGQDGDGVGDGGQQPGRDRALPP